MQSSDTPLKTSINSIVKETSMKQWDKLSEKQKKYALKIWQLITYKWQWQLALNTPILIIWFLDKTIPSIHEFDMKIINSLPLPHWLELLIGLK